VTSATYDAANELINWNGLTLNYDQNGNMLSDGSNSFTWNARNEVVKLNNVSLQYDAFGRRIQNAAGISFLYDGSKAAQELSGSTVIANLLSGGIDEVFTRTDSGGSFAQLKDALGSTIALVDSSGNMQTSYTYDPYGGTSVTGTGDGNEFQYTGRENDGNGLYFYRARYYSPLLGRFISEDPLGFAGDDDNLYAYAFDAPTDFIDPLGTDALQSPATVARTAFEVIEGGKESAATVAVEAAEIGGLGAADAALLAEEIQDVQAYNAENAAYDAELQAIHNLNQVLLTRPRPVPPLAGRYTPDQQRQREYERARDTCNAAVPDSGNLCSNLSRQIDHTKRCISLYESWDDRWAPGRHASKIATWQQRLSNLKRDHNDNCTDN
jgi:RHS repeat-associated protein